MSFIDFRNWLETDYVSPITSKPLGHDAPSDYASRLRTLSRLLEIDIENSEPGRLEDLAATFASNERIASTQTAKAVIDMRVALRRYAMFRRLRLKETSPATSPNPRRADSLAQDLQKLGFALTGTRRHTFELRNGDCIIYLKRLSDTLPVVIAPEYEVEYSSLANLEGVVASKPFGYYHNSQMPAFPKRTNRGRSAIHYGLDFDVVGSTTLSRLASALLAKAYLSPSESDRDEQNTETVRLQKARIGQGQFRADLFDVWKACPLSGVSTPDLLRASHIKPWRNSTEGERLDPNNGILLAVHLDCLFDKGFISLTDQGELLISARLPEPERNIFGLISLPPRVPLRPAHLPYLRHHRAHVYLDDDHGQVISTVRPA